MYKYVYIDLNIQKIYKEAHADENWVIFPLGSFKNMQTT